MDARNPGDGAPVVYRFHGCELDARCYQLRRDGCVVAVEPKVFDALLYLVRRRERVVSKEELRRDVWDGAAVGEAALTYCIAEARKAVGDDGRRQESIRTQHGRGYRFVAPVTEHVPSGGGDGPAELPDQPSLAVLPLLNLSGDPAEDWFGDGLTEDLITDLSKASGLFVIARQSAFAYKATAVAADDVGRALGVRYVLQGSVRRGDDRVRITARLVEAPTGRHLWAERYDGAPGDVFAVQDELRRKIITAVKVTLLPEEQARLRRAPTSDLAAYDCYLRGVEAYRRLTPPASLEARALFQQAIAADPGYAAAHAFLALTDMMRWTLLWSREPGLVDQALAAVRRALDLDHLLAGAHAVLAWVYAWKRLHEQAIAAAERALALDPNDAESCVKVAQTLNLAGRPDEARCLAERAMRLDPRGPAQYVYALGWSCVLAARWDEAISALERAAALRPDWGPPHLFLAVAHAALTRGDDARAAVAELRRIVPDLTLATLREHLPYRDASVLERQVAALGQAGLP